MLFSAPKANSCNPASSQSAAAGLRLPPMAMNSEDTFIVGRVVVHARVLLLVIAVRISLALVSLSGGRSIMTGRTQSVSAIDRVAIVNLALAGIDIKHVE